MDYKRVYQATFLIHQRCLACLISYGNNKLQKDLSTDIPDLSKMFGMSTLYGNSMITKDLSTEMPDPSKMFGMSVSYGNNMD